MKNRVLALLSLSALYFLFSSFTYLANSHAAAAAETHQSFWASMHNFSFEKLSFWQKTGLFLAVSSGTYALASRQYRRHSGQGIGCLGVLAVLVLVAVLIPILIPIFIILIPVALIIGLVVFILGLPFSRFNDRGRNRDRERSHRHYRRERF